MLSMSGMQMELMIAKDNHFIIYPFNTDANIYTKIVKSWARPGCGWRSYRGSKSSPTCRTE